jgi:hypothetical protein
VEMPFRMWEWMVVLDLMHIVVQIELKSKLLLAPMRYRFWETQVFFCSRILWDKIKSWPEWFLLRLIWYSKTQSTCGLFSLWNIHTMKGWSITWRNRSVVRVENPAWSVIYHGSGYFKDLILYEIIFNIW